MKAADVLRGVLAVILVVLADALGFASGAAGGIALCIAVTLGGWLLHAGTRKICKSHCIAAWGMLLPLEIAALLSGLYTGVYNNLNAVYIREYGKASIGDAMGLVYIWLPAVLFGLMAATLLADFLTRRHDPL